MKNHNLIRQYINFRSNLFIWYLFFKPLMLQGLFCGYPFFWIYYKTFFNKVLYLSSIIYKLFELSFVKRYWSNSIFEVPIASWLVCYTQLMYYYAQGPHIDCFGYSDILSLHHRGYVSLSSTPARKYRNPVFIHLFRDSKINNFNILYTWVTS